MKDLTPKIPQLLFPAWGRTVAISIVLGFFALVLGCDISPVPTPIPADEGGEYDDDYDEFGGVDMAEPMTPNLSGAEGPGSEGNMAPGVDEETDDGTKDEGVDEGGGLPSEEGGEEPGDYEEGGGAGGRENVAEEDAAATPSDVCGPPQEDAFDEVDAGTLGGEEDTTADNDAGEDDDEESDAEECW